jgi:hypothetical protein
MLHYKVVWQTSLRCYLLARIFKKAGECTAAADDLHERLTDYLSLMLAAAAL